MTKKYDIVVIGGGAAGFFSAINAQLNFPKKSVLLLEKTSKFLSKVKVSGGGRCNVTNVETRVSELVKNYPRGGKKFKKPLSTFGPKETIVWFEQRNVPLKAEEDGRMFPISNSSSTVIDCFLNQIKILGVHFELNTEIQTIDKTDSGFDLITNKGTIKGQKIIITTGGSSKPQHYNFIEGLGHSLTPLLPSLFTFNLEDKSITALSGLSVAEATVRIIGHKAASTGPLLVTHWGFSGPAVLKLSAFEAEHLSQSNYSFDIGINWLGLKKEEAVRTTFNASCASTQKVMKNFNCFDLPQRLWSHLLQAAEINENKKAAELSKKEKNKLIQLLTSTEYKIKGKTTFKEEFVTCGGVPLDEVNLATMESNKCPGVYFAGEVLNIDGVTGGFNFQSAWTTAYIAATHVGSAQ